MHWRSGQELLSAVQAVTPGFGMSDLLAAAGSPSVTGAQRTLLLSVVIPTAAVSFDIARYLRGFIPADGPRSVSVSPWFTAMDERLVASTAAITVATTEVAQLVAIVGSRCRIETMAYQASLHAAAPVLQACGHSLRSLTIDSAAWPFGRTPDSLETSEAAPDSELSQTLPLLTSLSVSVKDRHAPAVMPTLGPLAGQLQSFTMTTSFQLLSSSVELLARFTALQSVTLQRLFLTDACMAHLASLPRLATLRLQHCTGSRDLSPWAHNATLTDVALQGRSVVGAELTQLLALPCLTAVDVGGSALNDAEIVAAFSEPRTPAAVAAEKKDPHATTSPVPLRLPRLRSIDLSDSAIGSRGLRALVSAAPGLETLRLADCNKLLDSDIALMEDLPSLRTVVLRRSMCGAAGVSAFTSLPLLTSLDLSQCLGVGPALPQLCSCRTLRVLQVSRVIMSAAVRQQLKQGLPEQCLLDGVPIIDLQ